MYKSLAIKNLVKNRARELYGGSLTTFAKNVGIKYPTINAVLNGRNGLTKKTVKKLLEGDNNKTIFNKNQRILLEDYALNGDGEMDSKLELSLYDPTLTFELPTENQVEEGTPTIVTLGSSKPKSSISDNIKSEDELERLAESIITIKENIEFQTKELDKLIYQFGLANLTKYVENKKRKAQLIR